MLVTLSMDFWQSKIWCEEYFKAVGTGFILIQVLRKSALRWKTGCGRFTFWTYSFQGAGLPEFLLEALVCMEEGVYQLS
jgi:hypothetical protein